MDIKLLTPRDLDALLRYPTGRSARLAREGKIPHIKLPDGTIRFNAVLIEQIINAHSTSQAVTNAH